MIAEIEQVAETLMSAKEYGIKVNLLFGAGVSIEGGIPGSRGIVRDIKKKHPSLYKQAKPKMYSDLMNLLPPRHSQALINRYFDNSKINMANLYIAQLCRAKYIDRILTTNFDPLFTQACTLLRQDISIYDLADCREFRSFDIVEPAALYLHGRRAGFKRFNTPAECNSRRDTLKQIFDQSGQNRVWIVVGYSGQNDPVLDHLASIKSFDSSLYWVCYKNEDPPRHVRTRLLADNNWTYELKGYTADSFFVTLAQRLNCFLPDFIRYSTPKTRDDLDKLAPYGGQFHNNGFKVDFMPFDPDQLPVPGKKVPKQESRIPDNAHGSLPASQELSQGHCFIIRL